MDNSLGSAQVDQLLQKAAGGSIVFLVGAGGCGMSGLGHLLLDLGYQVHGSDLLRNEEIRQLQARGALIHQGHSSDQIAPGTLLVVYTSAARQGNAALETARELEIPIVRRAVL